MTDDQVVEHAAQVLVSRLHGGISLSNPNDLCLHAAIRLRGEVREVLLGYWLDADFRLIEVEEISTGGESALQYSARDIARRAVRLDARALALVHNHPNGDLAPSDADRDAIGSLQRYLSAIAVLAFGYVVTNAGAANISTGDRCTFVSTPITPAAALCQNCGTQTIGERS